MLVSRSIVLGLLTASLSACVTSPTVGPTTDNITNAITVSCRLIEVIVDTSNSTKIKENFGQGSFTDAVCDLFAPSGSASPVKPGETRTITVTLPDGRQATAKVVSLP
jgi:hypothetical protein